MTNFQCTFHSGSNSVKLISPTAELRTWLDHNLNLKDLRLTIQARNWPGATTDVTYPLQSPEKDKLELYKLTYPSGGVMHWGEMLVLISGDDLTKAQYIQKGTLTVQSGAGNQLDFSNMYLISTTPVCEVGDNNQASGRIEHTNDDFTLHLGLLVDERFFIANYSASLDSTLGCCGDWGDLIDQLLQNCIYDSAGITQDITVPTIDEAYGYPGLFSDLQELGETNAAMMLEAALTNCGLIIIRHINGQYEIKDYETASDLENHTDYASSSDGGASSTNGEPPAIPHLGYCLRAGGDWSRNGRNYWRGDLPKECVFYFPIWDEEYQYGYPDTDEEGSKHSQTDELCCFPPPGLDTICDNYPGAWENQWDGEFGEKLYHLRSPLNASQYYTYKVSKHTAFVNNGLQEPTGQAFGQKIFRETAKAKGSPPTNIYFLKKLAENLAGDFYSRKYWSAINEMWNLIVPPSGSGWLTYIYTYNDLDCSTRIIGDWVNHDVEQLMHDTCGSHSSSSESESSSSESSGSSSEISSSEESSSEESSSEISSSEEFSSQSESEISEFSSEVSESEISEEFSSESEVPSEHSEHSEQSQSSCSGPGQTPDGDCGGWVSFTDCDGGEHWYWGT